MFDRLAADGPYEPEIMLYGRLVGTWDVAWTRFDRGGDAAERREAEWRFAWILGGRGVQDLIWRKGDPPHLDGTTIRCWDARAGVWRLTFMSPADGEFVTMTARGAGDRIVQDLEGRPGEQWIFDHIAQTSFRWQARTDGRLTHEMLARRR